MVCIKIMGFFLWSVSENKHLTDFFLTQGGKACGPGTGRMVSVKENFCSSSYAPGAWF